MTYACRSLQRGEGQMLQDVASVCRTQSLRPYGACLAIDHVARQTKYVRGDVLLAEARRASLRKGFKQGLESPDPEPV